MAAVQQSALKGLSQKYDKSGGGRHVFATCNPSYCKVSAPFTFLIEALNRWRSHDRAYEQPPADEQDGSWASAELICLCRPWHSHYFLKAQQWVLPFCIHFPKLAQGHMKPLTALSKQERNELCNQPRNYLSLILILLLPRAQMQLCIRCKARGPDLCSYIN